MRIIGLQGKAQHRTIRFTFSLLRPANMSCLFSLTNSPRKARAIRRLGSELDTLPEDEPTPDSGTSSLESPKKPVSAR